MPFSPIPAPPLSISPMKLGNLEADPRDGKRNNRWSFADPEQLLKLVGSVSQLARLQPPNNTGPKQGDLRQPMSWKGQFLNVGTRRARPQCFWSQTDTLDTVTGSRIPASGPCQKSPEALQRQWEDKNHSIQRPAEPSPALLASGLLLVYR